MKRTLIIAEAGVNHNGDFEIAKKLIDVAALAGADFVKFQSFKADKLVSKSALKAEYQKKNTSEQDDNQYSMLKKLELPDSWLGDLIEYSNCKGITFLCTGFDNESIDILDQFNLPFFKIPSGEITNMPYLTHIASKGKPVILSTGMATMPEIKAAVSIFIDGGLKKNQITILHCNTEYPTPMHDVNLRAMLHIKEEFSTDIGYSDHTIGIEVPIAAVALGATIIEKHFTLDKHMEGPDHKASLEPIELTALVNAIRNIEDSLSGSGIKEPSPSEIKNLDIARKSVHLTRDLQRGNVINASDLEMLRPGNGISPMKLNEVLGRVVNKDLMAGTMLRFGDLA